MRADYTRAASERPRRRRWRQELEESPFERDPQDVGDRGGAGPTGAAATKVHAHGRASSCAAARASAASGAPRDPAAARRGARRPQALAGAWKGAGRCAGGAGASDADAADAAGRRRAPAATWSWRCGSARARARAVGARGRRACPSRAWPAARAALARAVGEEHVRDDHAARVSHAAGRAIPTWCACAGDGSTRPTPWSRPADARPGAAVLDGLRRRRAWPWSRSAGAPASSAGVEPLRGGTARRSPSTSRAGPRAGPGPRVARPRALEPGMLRPRAGGRLAARGPDPRPLPPVLRVLHGRAAGWPPARPGQASTGYGRIDELVQGVRCAAPAGRLRPGPCPRRPPGPSLRELMVGSEGTLGVITAATLQLRTLPAARRYEGVVVRPRSRRARPPCGRWRRRAPLPT